MSRVRGRAALTLLGLVILGIVALGGWNPAAGAAGLRGDLMGPGIPELDGVVPWQAADLMGPGIPDLDGGIRGQRADLMGPGIPDFGAAAPRAAG
ncbi:MAG TPA: hypothetical protein VIL38_05415 [Thermaerobacter sp.]